MPTIDPLYVVAMSVPLRIAIFFEKKCDGGAEHFFKFIHKIRFVFSQDLAMKLVQVRREENLLQFLTDERKEEGWLAWTPDEFIEGLTHHTFDVEGLMEREAKFTQQKLEDSVSRIVINYKGTRWFLHSEEQETIIGPFEDYYYAKKHLEKVADILPLLVQVSEYQIVCLSPFIAGEIVIACEDDKAYTPENHLKEIQEAKEQIEREAREEQRQEEKKLIIDDEKQIFYICQGSNDMFSMARILAAFTTGCKVSMEWNPETVGNEEKKLLDHVGVINGFSRKLHKHSDAYVVGFEDGTERDITAE